MSQERDLQTPSGVVKPLTRQEEESEFRARMVSIASRSALQSGLVVDLPDDLHGEWIPNDKLSIYQAQTIGFELPSEDVVNSSHSLHNDGTGKIITGDVIFMVMPKWKARIVNEERQKRINSLHSMKKNSPEERVFLDNAQGKEVGIETFNESTVHVTTKTMN